MYKWRIAKSPKTGNYILYKEDSCKIESFQDRETALAIKKGRNLNLKARACSQSSSKEKDASLGEKEQ